MDGFTFKVSEDKSKMTIEVDLTGNYGPSVSKKSDFIANSGGFVKLEGTDMKFSLNVIKPRPQE